jgi:hypothetical protein
MQRLGNSARGSRAESEDQRRPRSGPGAGHMASQAESPAKELGAYEGAASPRRRRLQEIRAEPLPFL